MSVTKTESGPSTVGVTALRHQVMQHRGLAAWLVVLALLMKVLVPSGYMLGTSGGSMTVELCSGYGAQEMVVAMPGMTDHSGKKQGHGKAEQPCAFAGLAAPSLAGTDPILLAAAIAFVMARVFRSPAPGVASAPAYLRPPSHAPPALRA